MERTEYLYILQSCVDGSFYVGSTIDLENRIYRHNKGFVKSTKKKIPLELRFFKWYGSIKDARKSEYKLKTFKSRSILERIITDQILKIDL